MRTVISVCTVAALLTACAAPAPKAADTTASDATANQAHENYVRVINSNNTDSLASMLTEDVVFLAAGEKPIVGKAAV